MKKQSLFLMFSIFAFLCFLSIACKKELNKANLPKEALALLPAKFANEMFDNGFDFNTGDNPSNVEGIYLFEPISDYDNSGAFPPGTAALDAKIKIANQSGKNADVYVYNWISGVYDTSEANLVIGKDENITIFAQAKGSTGGVSYKYTYVISGKKEAGGIRDMQFGFIMVDNPGAPLVSTTGTQRLFHDFDGIAENTAIFRSQQKTINDKLKNMFSN